MSTPAGQSDIARRAGLVAFGTLLSRISGAFRDAAIAATFTLAATDTFWLAFTIPNALRVLLGEGAVSAAIVPVYTDARTKEGEAVARDVYAKLLGAMSLLLSGVSVLGVLAAPLLVTLYAAGFHETPGLFDETVLVTRIVFPYILLVGLGAVAQGGLNANGRFFAAAFAPALLNIALALAPFLLLPLISENGLPSSVALAVAAMIGGVLSLLVVLPELSRAKLLVAPRLALSDPYVRRAMALLGPLVLGLGVYQLNVAVSRQFSSFLPRGSLSYFYYAQRLVEIPQGMFALAIASATLPAIASAASRGDEAEAKQLFRKSLRLTLVVAVPSTVALAVLAEPVVAVLFGRGLFDASAIRETGRSLLFQGLGVWAVASIRTIVPMFHGRKDTRSPVIASATNLVVFALTTWLLIGTFRHVAIAIAITTAAMAQLLMQLYLLRRRTGDIGLGEVAGAALRMLVASVAAGAVMFVIARHGAWHLGSTVRNAAVLAAAGAAGGVVYLVVAKLLRVQEIDAVLARLRR